MYPWFKKFSLLQEGHSIATDNTMDAEKRIEEAIDNKWHYSDPSDLREAIAFGMELAQEQLAKKDEEIERLNAILGALELRHDEAKKMLEGNFKLQSELSSLREEKERLIEVVKKVMATDLYNEDGSNMSKAFLASALSTIKE